MPSGYTQADQREQAAYAIEALNTGTYKGEGDIFDYTLFDRDALATGDTFNLYFQNGVGQAGKTLADTNVRGAGGIPKGQRLTIGAIKVFYTANAVADAATLQIWQEMVENAIVTFTIEGKANYGIWPLKELFNVPVGIVAQDTTEALSQSIGRYVGILPLNLPIVLSSLTTFELRVDHGVAVNAALDTDWLTFGLNGVLERLS